MDHWLLSFAPGHNLLATETAVGAPHDPRFGTTFSPRRNDLLKGVDCAASRVPIAGAKLSPERHRTDKGKQRQVTVAAIEAVRETSFLMTVQRVVGGIQIDDDLQAILGQAAHAHPQKAVFDCFMVGADFMATSIFIVAKLKAVKCRGAGQRLALILGSAPASKRILFTDSHGKERIEPQKIMIVEILVPCGHAQQTLGDQFAHGVFDKERITRIVKAAGQGPGDAQALIDLTQEQHPPITAEITCRKVGDDPTRTEVIKTEEQRLRTERRLGRSG